MAVNRKTLSQIYIFICAIIVVVSMVASLFKWVDVTTLLDYTWTILLFCFSLSIMNEIMKVISSDIHLITKRTFICVTKNTLYGYVMIVGTLSPLVIYGVSFNTGLIIFWLLHFSLLILYVVTIVVDRNKNKGAIKNEHI